MVINNNISNIKKWNCFLKYFFFLWKKKYWTGGRSWGVKVFRGQVGKISGWRFIFKIIWNYSIFNINGIVQFFLYPFNFTSVFSLLFFFKYGFIGIVPTEETSYISNLYRHDLFSKDISFGNSTLISNFIVGTNFFSLQLLRYWHSTIARSSGTTCKILKKTDSCAFVQFPSKLVWIIPLFSAASRGMSKKIDKKKLYKAGNSYILGWIPKVRGIAMNPVDHPHGGWTNGGCHPRTPKGFLTKNVKTWKWKCWSNPVIFSLWK